MDLAMLCTFIVSLRVIPNRVQFFQYDTVYLSCGNKTNASKWTILRNTSLHTNQKNPAQNKSNWFMNSNMYYKDAGVYWCQSEEGECGAAVNISVTAGDVILESPVLPVKEGETVTLRCIWNPDKPITEGTFEFFKDGFCVGNSTSGDLTIPIVSHSDSGLYTCSHQGELSAESQLNVLQTAGRLPQLSETASSITSFIIIIVLPVTAATLALLCTILVFLWRKHKESRLEQSTFLVKRVGENGKMPCAISDYSIAIYNIGQRPGQGLQRISRMSAGQEQFSLTEYVPSSTQYMEITGLTAEDTAVYYCARRAQ
ncbi:low affinity immunoglobulin gamma Fc region receptor II-b-like [Boleophthalmus pectinirostris]|uniref:low affinity immunoglobulin gamma Fc region receptor II-b-like n=1 Tax=Boleophthalmus pectinirostris TaxID=150288 RepID=UPI002431B281|nr:low affinity immunoglobulin gamma Fc region receptor II-b-like [Boleophthalmus pectinirostris]